MGCTQSDANAKANVPKGQVQRRLSQFEAQNSSSRLRQQSSSNLGQKTDTRRPSRRPSERRASLGGVSIRCKKCGEGIGKADEAKDSKGNIYHVACLKCVECGVKLHLRELVPLSTIRMTKEQYCFDEKSRKLFCNKHAPTIERAQRRTSIKGHDTSEKVVNDKELSSVSSSRRDLNKEAKEVLEESGGFSAELKCARCGQLILKEHKMTTSGMMRYHELCPSKEEIAKADKSIKYFLEKLPDRFAAQLEGPDPADAKTLLKSTFLYVRDNPSYKDALKQASVGNRQISVVYLPDTTARDGGAKRFRFSEGSVDFTLRQYPQANFAFGGVNGQESLSPCLRGNTLVIPKQCFANGILHGFDAIFSYNESEGQVSATRLIMKFERPQDMDGNAGSDPLKALKMARRETASSATSDLPKLRTLSRYDCGQEPSSPLKQISTRSMSRYDSNASGSEPPSPLRPFTTSSRTLSRYESSSSEPAKNNTLHRHDSGSRPMDATAIVEAAGQDLALPSVMRPSALRKEIKLNPAEDKPPPLPKNKPRSFRANTIDTEMV